MWAKVSDLQYAVESIFRVVNDAETTWLLRIRKKNVSFVEIAVFYRAKTVADERLSHDLTSRAMHVVGSVS